MEPQVTAEHYMITLTDDNGSVRYYKERLEVGDFINGIRWGEHGTRHFSVEPVEPLAEWELELLGCVNEEAAVSKLKAVLTRDELQMHSAIGPEPEEEWRVIESLPIRSFEIDRGGNIRHRASKRLMEAHFDIDHQTYRTHLIINGQTFSVSGQLLAQGMWREEANAS